MNVATHWQAAARPFFQQRGNFSPAAQKLICHFSKVDTHQGGCGMNKTQRRLCAQQ
jgi:hypothetical protein